MLKREDQFGCKMGLEDLLMPPKVHLKEEKEQLKNQILDSSHRQPDNTECSGDCWTNDSDGPESSLLHQLPVSTILN